MSHGQRVLVVDGLSEVQEVLQAVLEPRGLRVDWVRNHVHSPSSPAQNRPDLVILDAEAIPDDLPPDDWAGVPQVIIGGVAQAVSPLGPQRQYLNKPFQYTELIRAIEQLLPRRVA